MLPFALDSEQASAGQQARDASRSRLRTRDYRVVAHGLTYFCRKLSSLMNGDQWDVRDRSQHDPAGVLRLLRDLRSCDLAFSWGGRLDMGPFLRAAKFLRTPDVVIFWCGSDVLRSTELRKRAAPDPWILKQIHWAASESLAGEVRSLGVDCEFVQSSFVPRIKDPAPLPETFSVTVYLPAPKLADLYGWNIVSNVARSLPHINFNLVGLREGTLDAPPNVRIHPWIADLTLVYRQSTVLWRPVRHDAGISFMVLEALSHGRHVLYSYPVPGAVQARDAREAAFHLQHLFELHSAGLLPLNRAGIDAVARVYSREVVREELRRRWAGIIDARPRKRAS